MNHIERRERYPVGTAGARPGRGAPAAPARAAWTCGRCRIAFRRERPEAPCGVEWLRCPDCGIAFWSEPAGGTDGRVRVGLAGGGSGAAR